MNQSNLIELEILSDFTYLFEQESLETTLNDIREVLYFKKPVGHIILNSHIEYDITPFIDYMNTYFFIEANKTNSNIILISRFKNYIEVVNQYGKFEEVLRFLSGTSLKNVFDYCSKNSPSVVKLNRVSLKKVKVGLHDFEHLLEYYEKIEQDIAGAYTAKKPVSSIKFYNTVFPIDGNYISITFNTKIAYLSSRFSIFKFYNQFFNIVNC